MDGNILISHAVLALIFVNGSTDAPNSVAGAVAGGTLSYFSACLICAAFNFLGMLISSIFFPAVAESIASIADCGADGALAALASVVIFSTVAWLFGIPTSESHGLIASLGGAGLYYNGSLNGEFLNVTVKSVLSCALGFAVGYIFLLIVKRLAKRTRLFFKRKNEIFISAFCASGASFSHGMQDGQKFTVLLLLSLGSETNKTPVSVALVCAFVMALGCLAGGRKIINKLGLELSGRARPEESTASDVGALVCTVAASVLGIPVSTTYMKTCSMLGSASALGKKVNPRVSLELVLTWALTYPACMALSYAVCALLDRF